MGTGVILDGRGYILTNQHVVDRVQGIEVLLSDGTSYPARVVQQDPSMDIALLKIDAGRPLPAIRIGTSSDLMVGETVITIGNAFGYENTVSVGIISALNRNVTLSDDQVYRNLIQTDACINPGNSGGPLVNIDGELIGINVAVRAGAQGIGFALPIDDVKTVALEMMSTRRLAATWHGIVDRREPAGGPSRGLRRGRPGRQSGRNGRVPSRRPAPKGRPPRGPQPDRPGARVSWTCRPASRPMWSSFAAARSRSCPSRCNLYPRAVPDPDDQIWTDAGPPYRAGDA